MTKGSPFTPLVKITGGAEGPGRMQPVLDEEGVPFWQSGDVDPSWFAVTQVGWFSGNVSSMQTYDDIHGWVYVTGARAIIVTADFAKGSQYRAVGVPSLTNLAYMATANRSLKSRAHKANGWPIPRWAYAFPLGGTDCVGIAIHATKVTWPDQAGWNTPLSLRR